MLQKTYNVEPPRADLNRNDFDQIIYQKGRRVLYEKSLRCPCKSTSTNQLPNCKNCGGTGWLFINGKETRMVITGVAVTNDFKAWSEESRGTIRVTANESEHITYMDKITLLDANSIHTEVLNLRRRTSGSTHTYFGYTCYPIKNLIYIGLFRNASTKLTVLSTSDITYGNKNLIILSSDVLNANEDDVSITLRYFHAPSYLIAEMTRETMQSFKYVEGTEEQQNFPLSAIAKRTHYLMNTVNLDSIGLLDNNFTEIDCDISSNSNIQDCTCTSTIVIPNTAIATTLRFPFTNQNSISITHSFAREPQVSIYDLDGNEIGGAIEVTSSNTVLVSFNQQVSGVIIVQ